MADLQDREVAVDYAANESRFGPSGKRARQASSCYLLVGGSADVYRVTISTQGAHFCAGSTAPCKGNLGGKGRKYGPVNARNPKDPQQWCKHVQAALKATELVAEAQEVTARTFAPTNVKRTTVEEAARRLAEVEEEREAALAALMAAVEEAAA